MPNCIHIQIIKIVYTYFKIYIFNTNPKISQTVVSTRSGCMTTKNYHFVFLPDNCNKNFNRLILLSKHIFASKCGGLA